MPKRKANAVWKGDLQNGTGTVKLGSGAYEGSYSFKSRFKDGEGTNPEELIGAAHAGCYAMALSNELAEAGHEPDSVDAKATVTLDLDGEDPAITGIKLTVNAHVPDIEEDDFMEFAEAAKTNCPVSKALAAVDIELEATLRN